MDIEGYLRFVFALAFVLALIGILAWAARRFGLASTTRLPGQPRRLRIVEAIALDSRRRLVLVRRDDTEHLLLTGGPNDLVVHSRDPLANCRETHASPPPVETGIETTPNPKAPAP